MMKRLFLNKCILIIIVCTLISCSNYKPVTQADVIGAWYHPETNTPPDRFGHSIFYFDQNGNLTLLKLDNPAKIKMHYEFVSESEIVITGYDDLSSIMHLRITSEDKLSYCADYYKPYTLHLTCVGWPEMERISIHEANKLVGKYWAQTNESSNLSGGEIIVLLILVIFVGVILTYGGK